MFVCWLKIISVNCFFLSLFILIDPRAIKIGLFLLSFALYDKYKLYFSFELHYIYIFSLSVVVLIPTALYYMVFVYGDVAFCEVYYKTNNWP